MTQIISTYGFNFKFDLKDHNILIVDDNPTNLSVIVEFLEDSGLTVLVSQDGKSSLKRAKFAKPDIILLDVLMPGIDGYETCSLLKSDPETQDIPVIFMTALSDTEDKLKGFEMGAVDYVTKPIQAAEVLARIKLHLQLRYMTKTLTRQNEVLKIEVEEKIAAQKALKELNLELEQRVKQRTVLLAKSNHKLQREIVDRKQAENRLKNSLDEKEILLKEIYHRVKNNLLVVSSLLEIQGSCIEDPEIRKILKNSQDRIFSMALVHEQLYRSENLQEIDLGSYIQALLDKIFSSHVNCNEGINFVVDTQEIYLNIETANSCGLIINELVTNALEHAFKGREGGNIFLSLQRTDERKIVLSIGDDGLGLPEDFDFDEAESLGLRLVRVLTRQLEGKMELERKEGTQFKIIFSELDYQDRLN